MQFTVRTLPVTHFARLIISPSWSFPIEIPKNPGGSLRRMFSTILLKTPPSPSFHYSLPQVFLPIPIIFHVTCMLMIPKCVSPPRQCHLSSRVTHVNSLIPNPQICSPSVFFISLIGLFGTCPPQKPLIHPCPLLPQSLITRSNRGSLLNSSKPYHLSPSLPPSPFRNHFSFLRPLKTYFQRQILSCPPTITTTPFPEIILWLSMK